MSKLWGDELVLDVETTTFQNGNPFSERNKLCYVGTFSKSTDGDLYDCTPIEYSDTPYHSNLLHVKRTVERASLLIGFNIKFDLHWIRRYGIDFSHVRVWDCQLVHFILTNQENPYPSLNDVAAYYGLEPKLDIVATEYWDRGIDTTEIPSDTLEEYLSKDLELTWEVYQRQKKDVELLSSSRQRLISLHNQDLLVLEEMEWNGLIYDAERSKQLAEETQSQIESLRQELLSYHRIDGFNANSGDHVSVLLYGGTISIPRRVVVGTFKTGTRAGQPKERWQDQLYELPRRVTPLKGSKLKKEGYYATDEQTLKSLKADKETKKLINLLLEISLLEKRVGTYYQGLINLIEEYNWKDNTLHGQLNQCVARTGRLSSSKPNLQNFDGEIKPLFRSRYGN